MVSDQGGLTFRIRIADEDFGTLTELAASVFDKAPETPQEVLMEGIFSQIREQIPNRVLR